MEKVLITCPFTGMEFEALKYADGRLVTSNKITGEEIQITYNPSIDRYMLSARLFKHIPLVTMEECAEILGVSKPRVSALVKKGRLQTVRPGASLYITKDSMLDYKRQQRKAAVKDDHGTGTD
jgi:excisionase family DNA binding protein